MPSPITALDPTLDCPVQPRIGLLTNSFLTKGKYILKLLLKNTNQILNFLILSAFKDHSMEFSSYRFENKKFSHHSTS